MPTNITDTLQTWLAEQFEDGRTAEEIDQYLRGADAAQVFGRSPSRIDLLELLHKIYLDSTDILRDDEAESDQCDHCGEYKYDCCCVDEDEDDDQCSGCGVNIMDCECDDDLSLEDDPEPRQPIQRTKVPVDLIEP